MKNKFEMQAPSLGRLQRVARAVKKLLTRGRGEEMSQTQPQTQQASTASETAQMSNSAKPGRVTRREADIPMDVIERTYNPRFTGGKAGFRSDGSDHQNDQEFALGHADDRWNDEDRITNKSGDPRIGTHRRTYEPGEAVREELREE